MLNFQVIRTTKDCGRKDRQLRTVVETHPTRLVANARKNRLNLVASRDTDYSVVPEKMDFEIEEVLMHIKDSDLAYDYLEKIIDRSSPDYFHWTDVEEALRLWELDFGNTL